MKILCAPLSSPCTGISYDLRVDLFQRSGLKGRGSAGNTIPTIVRRQKLPVVNVAWDLVSLALSVIAADLSHRRSTSADGWTREFSLVVAVTDPQLWTPQTALIEELLRYLTTDRWSIEFVAGGYSPVTPKSAAARPEESVVLLSGGLDSLIGAIDLVALGRTPLAVAQIVRGDSEKQKAFASRIGSGLHLLQLNHNVEVPDGETPPSQRARSLGFLAFGVLAATTLKNYAAGVDVDMFVCENGFIGINPPLTPARVGSLSTRTTHPIVLSLIQEIVRNVGIHVNISNPYRHKTKGEMLVDCKDQALLALLACSSTSCGRFKQFKLTHCGRCVPCLIRRSSFLRAGMSDSTKYKFKNLSIKNNAHMRFDDVRAAKMAVEQVKKTGVDRWIGATLASDRVTNADQLRDVARRGLAELDAFLQTYNVK